MTSFKDSALWKNSIELSLATLVVFGLAAAPIRVAYAMGIVVGHDINTLGTPLTSATISDQEEIFAVNVATFLTGGTVGKSMLFYDEDGEPVSDQLRVQLARDAEQSMAPTPLPSNALPSIYKDEHFGWAGAVNRKNRYYFDINDYSSQYRYFLYGNVILGVTDIEGGLTCIPTNGILFVETANVRNTVWNWTGHNTNCVATETKFSPNQDGLTSELEIYARGQLRSRGSIVSVDVSDVIKGNGRYVASWQWQSGCCGIYIGGMELKAKPIARILTVEIVRPDVTDEDIEEVALGAAFVVKVTLENKPNVNCPSVTVRNTTRGNSEIAPTKRDKSLEDQPDEIICITLPVEVVPLK